MPTLALAGGASASLGRAIIIPLLSSPKTKDWDAVILSRSERKPVWLQAVDPDGSRVQVRAVNYLSVDALVPALRGVDTLISVIQALDGTQATTQINLVNAAVQAGCRRFVPSYWGWGPKGWENASLAKEAVEGVWEECAKYKDKMECAKFNAGAFMNYIGHGIYAVPGEVSDNVALQAMKEGGGYMPGEDAACQGLLRFGPLTDGSGGLMVGMKNGVAELPVKDDGSWPRMTWTALEDVGRFVVASLTLPKWEEWMSIVGETLTVGEMLAHAEAVTGNKFKVTLEKREELEEKFASLPPEDFLNRMWTEFKISYIRDQDEEGVLSPVVNKLCPEVHPIGVRQYMDKFWKV